MKTWCVIVCYRPNVETLRELCAVLSAQSAAVVLVDNTELPEYDLQLLIPGCRLTTLGFNSGIAHAQNIGIQTAIDAGADVVALFDQDSQIAPGFLAALVAPLRLGVPAVVSPLYYDDISQQELPSLAVSKCGISSAIHREGQKDPYPVDVVISSGTAATREVYENAGLLDESLFIDFVDTEWCLRCRDKDIPILVVPEAVMHHRIGSRAIATIIMTILAHNPARCYYQLRNCFLLFGKKHIPLLFSIKQLVAVFASRLLLLFFVNGRLAYLKAYAAALKDGITGVTGPNPRDAVP
jgi:rhamnosyltransferase